MVGIVFIVLVILGFVFKLLSVCVPPAPNPSPNVWMLRLAWGSWLLASLFWAYVRASGSAG
jgi:hypothetical protein